MVLLDSSDPCTECASNDRLLHKDLGQEVIPLREGLNPLHDRFGHVVNIKTGDTIHEVRVSHFFPDFGPISTKLSKHCHDSHHDVLNIFRRCSIGFDFGNILLGQITDSLVSCLEDRHSISQISVGVINQSLGSDSLLREHLRLFWLLLLYSPVGLFLRSSCPIHPRLGRHRGVRSDRCPRRWTLLPFLGCLAHRRSRSGWSAFPLRTALLPLLCRDNFSVCW